MLRFILFILIALSMGPPAAACSWTTLPVEQSVDNSQAVVWARPIDITNSRVRAASDVSPASFTQTIHWQVIDSWKGPHTVGKTFTSKQEVATSSACGGFTGHKDKSPRLLYLFGKEPFTQLNSTAEPTAEEAAYFRKLKVRGSRPR